MMALIGKRPSIVYWVGDNLYLNITNRCSNHCYFCFRKLKNGIQGFNLKLHKEPSTDEIIGELQKVINRKHWREIVFCGFGEPLERLDYVLEITRWIKKHAKKVVRINTNGQGYLLNRNRDVVKELREAGVDRVSVSLNTHDKETYNHVCRPKFEDAFQSILEFIQKARGELNVEITAVTVPEVDISKVSELATKMRVEFRVRPYITCFW